MSEQKPTNIIRLGLKGNQVDLFVIATSEATAQRIYQRMEQALTDLKREDLEHQWNQLD
jgi:hypothetical protein